MISPREPTKYTGVFYQNVASYTRGRDPTTADLFPKENQGKYPIISLWSNNVANKIWGLVNIVNNQAIWILLASGNSGPVLQFTPASGSSPVFPDANGNVTLFGVLGGGVTTVGAANTVLFQMQSPFDLSNFAFTKQVGIQGIPSASPLIPLTMTNTLAGNYLTSLSNLSTADFTQAGYVAGNAVSNVQFGIGGTGFVSNPIIQGNGFVQTSAGAGFVISISDPAQFFNLYIGGNQMINVQSSGGLPIVQIFNGYLDLANQTKVNSFQLADLSVPNGGSANVVIIGSQQQWQFFASTNTNTPDATYRAAATVLSSDAGVNSVDNYVTSKLTFAATANQITIANAGAATVRVMISAVRMF